MALRGGHQSGRSGRTSAAHSFRDSNPHPPIKVRAAITEKATPPSPKSARCHHTHPSPGTTAFPTMPGPPSRTMKSPRASHDQNEVRRPSRPYGSTARATPRQAPRTHRPAASPAPLPASPAAFRPLPLRPHTGTDVIPGRERPPATIGEGSFDRWAQTDSNRRHLLCKSSALPLSYAPWSRRQTTLPYGPNCKPAGISRTYRPVCSFLPSGRMAAGSGAIRSGEGCDGDTHAAVRAASTPSGPRGAVA